MLRIEVSEKGKKEKYLGKMSSKVALGKTLAIQLDDGNTFNIVKVSRALTLVSKTNQGYLMMLEDNAHRRFKIVIIQGEIQ